MFDVMLFFMKKSEFDISSYVRDERDVVYFVASPHPKLVRLLGARVVYVEDSIGALKEKTLDYFDRHCDKESGRIGREKSFEYFPYDRGIVSYVQLMVRTLFDATVRRQVHSFRRFQNRCQEARETGALEVKVCPLLDRPER